MSALRERKVCPRVFSYLFDCRCYGLNKLRPLHVRGWACQRPYPLFFLLYDVSTLNHPFLYNHTHAPPHQLLPHPPTPFFYFCPHHIFYLFLHLPLPLPSLTLPSVYKHMLLTTHTDTWTPTIIHLCSHTPRFSFHRYPQFCLHPATQPHTHKFTNTHIHPP